MSAKTQKTAAAATVPGDALAPLNYLADLSRQQLAVAAQASCAMFRGIEVMRKVQQEAAHQASVRHESAAHKLHGSIKPVDLLEVQSILLQGDLQSATQYWQQLTAAAMEMQTEMMGCATHMVDSETALHNMSVMDTLDMVPGLKEFFPRKASAA